VVVERLAGGRRVRARIRSATLLTAIAAGTSVAFGSCAVATAPALRVDVCVYGASAAGIVAAVQSAREGRTVALCDCDGWLGGMTTAGLGATDVGNAHAIGGLAR
jgi:NADPH-dependent 2,4-dienoyl-CoA reductase/sulfur reductase-like enzyme